MWNLKYDTNEPIYETETTLMDIENRLVVAKGEGVGGGMEWEVAVSRCKLLYTGWINNKSYYTAQRTIFNYPMINHNGKEYLKKRKYREFPGGPVVRTLHFHC